MSLHETNQFVANCVLPRKHVNRYALCLELFVQLTFLGPPAAQYLPEILLFGFSTFTPHFICLLGVYYVLGDVHEKWCHKAVLAALRWPPILISAGQLRMVKNILFAMRWPKNSTQRLQLRFKLYYKIKPLIRKFCFSSTFEEKKKQSLWWTTMSHSDQVETSPGTPGIRGTEDSQIPAVCPEGGIWSVHYSWDSRDVTSFALISVRHAGFSRVLNVC